jgi:hypothetical protein
MDPDPDPYKNATDLEHCFQYFVNFHLFLLPVIQSFSAECFRITSISTLWQEIETEKTEYFNAPAAVQYFIFGYQYSNYIFCPPLGHKFSNSAAAAFYAKNAGQIFTFSARLSGLSLACQTHNFSAFFPSCSRRKNDQLADFSLTLWTTFL